MKPDQDKLISQLRTTLATTIADLAATTAALARVQADLAYAQRALAVAEWWTQGLHVRNCAIQQLEQVSPGEAIAYLALYRQQDGCYGGRLLPGNRLQTFWAVGDMPVTAWALLDVHNAVLPEGSRYVLLLPNQARAMGLWAHPDPAVTAALQEHNR